MRKVFFLLLIVGNLITINIKGYSLSLCQISFPKILLNQKQAVNSSRGSYDFSDSPQITSFWINTTHVKEGYQIDAWANVQKSQKQNKITEVKAILANGDEFILNLQSSNLYSNAKFYGFSYLPLGLAKIVATDQSGKSDTVSKNLTNVVEELPIIIYPKLGELVSNTMPTFHWKTVKDGQSTIRYTLLVYRSDFATVIWRKDNFSAIQIQFNSDGKATELLEDGSSYILVVYAFDNLGNASHDKIDFTIGIYNITEKISICNGQNYNGWTTSGTYQRTLKSISGCDSIVTTILNVISVYAQEYHIVYRTPSYVSGQKDIQGEDWVWWRWGGNNPENVTGNNWQRDISSKGYPLLGPYDSRNKDIIRWQIQLAKNSGLSGLFVDIFLDDKGHFRSDLINIFKDILNISQEESFKVGILDEVMFSNKNGENIDTMTARTIRFLKTYKDHPAYLKINNQPVYFFHFYTHLNGWTYSDLNKYYNNVEAQIGDVYWLIAGGSHSDLLSISKLDAISTTFLAPPQRESDLDSIGWLNYRNKVRNFVSDLKSFNKSSWIQQFPGFDEEKLHREEAFRTIDRDDGNFIKNQLNIAKEENANYIMVSSFNDWCENSNFEPGWLFDDYKGDPYQYPKTIANFLEKEFTPPPLPHKESVDQLMWGKLYGIDKAGPFPSDFSNNCNKVTIKLEDDISNISEVEYFIDGNHSVRVKDKSESNNLRLIVEGDGDTSPVIKGGREARIPLKPNVYYHYFSNPAFLKGDYNVYITIEYFDEGFHEFCINYQSTSEIWETTPFIFKTNTNLWKTATFFLNHIAFGKGQNYGADFRIYSPYRDLAVARVGIIFPGEGARMSSAEGSYDSLNEYAQINLPTIADNDLHGIYIRGKDNAYNWGAWHNELIQFQNLSFTENKAICQGQNYNGWTTSGTYKRTLQSKSGCDSIVTTKLTVNQSFQPEIILTGDTLKSKNAYSNYQWYDSKGLIPEATQEKYIIDRSDKYQLVITDKNGCSNSSATINAIYSYAGEIDSTNFKYSIIPNPNTGQFSFRVDSAPKDDFTLKLINPVGQVVELRKVKNAEVNHDEKFDVLHLSKGIYLLVVTTDWMNATEKIIVQ